MSHEGAPPAIINEDGSINEGVFSERGIKLNLDQAISHKIGEKHFEGTVGEMFASCPYIGEMVNQANINGGTDAAITALQFVGMTAGVEIVSPVEAAAMEAEETKEAESVKKNQIYPMNPPMT